MPPQISYAEVESALKAALECLSVNDQHLINVRRNERSITHRLGLYLQILFPLWHVDCEVNNGW